MSFGKESLQDEDMSQVSPEDTEQSEDMSIVVEEDEPDEIVQQSFTPDFMSRDELTEYYHAELDEIRHHAAEQAYTEAVIKRRGELAECIKRVEIDLEEVQNLQNKFMTQYAKELKYFAIDVAEKLISEKVKTDDKILKKLVMQTVDGIRSSSWLDIELSEKLVGLIEEIREDLKKSEVHGRITISPMAHPTTTCRINTEEGTVVSSVGVQAENLRKLFRTMDESK